MGKAIAVIETVHGTIKLEFFDDKAPGHVKNFKDLAGKNFYDGTTFHRVLPGFMIQAGDPNSKTDRRPGLHHRRRVQRRQARTGRPFHGAVWGTEQRRVAVFHLRQRCVFPRWAVHGVRQGD